MIWRVRICLFFIILWDWAIIISEKTYVSSFNDRDGFCQKRFNQILKCFLNCFTNLTVCDFKKFYFVEIIFSLLNVDIKRQHVFAVAMFSEIRTSKTFCFAWFLLIINIIIASIWYAVLLYDRFVFWFISFEIIFWVCLVFDFCLSVELLFFLWRRNSNNCFSSIWFDWRSLESDAWRICRFENVRVERKEDGLESSFWKTIFKAFIDKKIETDREFFRFVNKINDLKNFTFANCFFFSNISFARFIVFWVFWFSMTLVFDWFLIKLFSDFITLFS